MMMMRLKLVILCWICYCTAINTPERERVTVRSLKTRDLSENEKEIQLRAFGTNYHLLLKRSDVFAPNFKLVSVTHSPDGETILETRQIENDPAIDIFYQTDGSASLSVTEGDQLQVEGILDDGVRIYPVDDDGTQTDHVVERQVFKRDLVHDYIAVNESEADLTLDEDEVSRQRRQTASVVTVEVLPVLDYPNSDNLGQDETRIKKYLGIAWNNVNTRYSKATDPQIKVVIAGVVTFKRLEDQTFINSDLDSEGRVNESMIYAFNDWMLQNKNSLPNYDETILHLSYDAGYYEDGKWNKGVAGLAFIGRACATDGLNVGFAEDKAPYYSGVEALAHELAHSLNVLHDGEGTSSACASNDGHIMGTSTQFSGVQFSECSLTSMRNFVRSAQAECLQNTATPKYPLINEAPGLKTDADVQCKTIFGDQYKSIFMYNNEICGRLWCGVNASYYYTHGTAFEGTTCGYNKVCVEGVCSANPVPSSLEQCKSRSKYYSAAANENDSSFCRNLKCRNWLGFYESVGVPPVQGTLCGNAGRCIDQVCVGEVPSLDVQCQRLLGNDYKYYKYPSAEPCKALWCIGSDNSTFSAGGAFESSKCGDNRFCKDKVCTTR